MMTTTTTTHVHTYPGGGVVQGGFPPSGPDEDDSRELFLHRLDLVDFDEHCPQLYHALHSHENYEHCVTIGMNTALSCTTRCTAMNVMNIASLQR